MLPQVDTACGMVRLIYYSHVSVCCHDVVRRLSVLLYEGLNDKLYDLFYCTFFFTVRNQQDVNLLLWETLKYSLQHFSTPSIP